MAATMSVAMPIIHELQRVVGKQYVFFKAEDLLVFENDASIDRALPQLVAVPANARQVAEVMSIAHRQGIPVVPRGAGTGLSGGATAVRGGLLLSLTRLNRILEIDPVDQLAVAETGVVNLDISKAAEPYGLRYAPDPSSQKACTIGGNLAENSGGPHCLAYGVTANHVFGMEVVLADGSTVWFGDRTREQVGYDLRGVYIGSEGTLGVATKAVVQLMPLPEAVETIVAAFSRMEDASTAVSRLIGSGIVPAAIEMLDRLTIQAVEPAVHAGYPEEAEGVLLVEVEGLRESVEEEAAEVRDLCREQGAIDVRSSQDPVERARLWAGRKGALGALGRLAPSYYLLDGVVPRTRILEALRRVREVSEEHGLPIANVFHAGDGNLHPCILFDERVPDQTERAKAAGGAILRMCVELGGALSGEHGVGIEKQEYMGLCFSEADLEAMARLKPAFGSFEHLNPGKVFPTGATCCDMSYRAAVTRAGADAFI